MENLNNQLEKLLTRYSEFQSISEYNDLSDLPKKDRQSLVSRSIAAVRRISGTNSSYANDIERILESESALFLHTSSIMGIVQALRDDIKDGYIESLIEIVHADVF